VINVGSGFEISIGDTVRTVSDVMGVDIEIEMDEERLRPVGSEVARLLPSNEKALEVLGWRPEYGGADGFRRGLAKTVEWFGAPGNLTAYKPELYN
jgi:dTDP-glucose 4,6-dehydratase